MLAAYYRLGHAIWTLEITLVQSRAHTEETPTEATVQPPNPPKSCGKNCLMPYPFKWTNLLLLVQLHFWSGYSLPPLTALFGSFSSARTWVVNGLHHLLGDREFSYNSTCVEGRGPYLSFGHKKHRFSCPYPLGS